MKKYIILTLIAISLSGCVHIYEDNGEVISVDKTSDGYLLMIEQTDIDNGCTKKVLVETNTLYAVGDKVKLVKEK